MTHTNGTAKTVTMPSDQEIVVTRAFNTMLYNTRYVAVVTLLLGFLAIATRGAAQTENNPGGETMQTVTSKDGTTIAFDKLGQGEPLILVAGALSSRAVVTPLAELLAKHFTVYNYDRRGRGDSSDTQPYAVKREIEDIEAVIDAAGGSAFVYGHSSGAVLALEATSKLPTKVKKLALYEAPLILDESRPALPNDYVAQLNTAIAAGDRSKAVEIFMTKAINLPAEDLEGMKTDPLWAFMEALAHTIAYDGMVVGNTMSGEPLEAEVIKRWGSATIPTLVMSGANSEGFFHTAAQTLVDVLPDAQFQMMEGQDHGVAPEALTPVLVAFFAK